MKNMTRTAQISLVLLTGVSLAACAPLFERGFSQPVPSARAVQADLRSSIGYYENAATAINGRHYALALDYLQAARTQKPDDIRVLTAFGVVYDKLGRFDLSARYYAQAATLDPKSPIVVADLDYSRKLQRLSTVDLPSRVADSGSRPTEGPFQTVAISQGAAGLAVASANTEVRSAQAGRSDEAIRGKPLTQAKMDVPPAARTIFLTGHPLSIVDASGRSDTDRSVRTYLSGRGWSVAKVESAKAPTRPQTMIVYKETMVTVAKALARTLSLPTRLAVRDDVQGLQLILGRDISGTDLAGRSPRAQHRQLALVTVKPSTQE